MPWYCTAWLIFRLVVLSESRQNRNTTCQRELVVNDRGLLRRLLVLLSIISRRKCMKASNEACHMQLVRMLVDIILAPPDRHRPTSDLSDCFHFIS